MSEHQPPARRNLPFRLSMPANDRLAIHIVYALYAATVVSGFPGMLGVLLAYLKRDEVAGSALESHVTWQLRTFWLWLIMWMVGFAGLIVFVGWFMLIAAQVWLIYRIIKGWLLLADGRPVDRPDEFF